MGNTVFNIVLNIKSGQDFQTFGKFFLGNNRNFAESIFLKLKGDKKISRKAIICLELHETRQELPLNVQILACTLDELAENCKMITREVFKQFNLEQR